MFELGERVMVKNACGDAEASVFSIFSESEVLIIMKNKDPLKGHVGAHVINPKHLEKAPNEEN